MRAVLGFVFLLGGFFVAWLVLSGKFPAAPVASDTGGAAGSAGGTTHPPLPPTGGSNPHGGPGMQASTGGMALPTMLALSHQASLGGMV